MEKNNFVSGVTELLVLSLVNEQDRYVYEIVKEIEARSGDQLKISQNTLYTATYKLLNDEMISEYNVKVGKKRTRVYYKITENGKKYLKKIRENYDRTSAGTVAVLDSLKSAKKSSKKKLA